MATATGLDLSLTATGTARSDGSCTRFGRPGVTNLSLSAQTAAIEELAGHAITAASHGGARPDLVLIEGPEMGMTYGGAVERIGLYWQVVRRLLLWEVRLAVVPSAQLKQYATGKGNAPKTAVVDAVARRWPQFDTRGDDNLADAAVLCALGMHLLGQPLADPTAAQEALLARIRYADQPPPAKKSKKATAR